jgi:oxaloacetate decarboxylase alpha subunit
MALTYGHSATESIVTILEGTPHDTGLHLQQLEEIAAYFRTVRPKYAQFEGALKGVDSRILVAQVPGGMFSNMENQLREQGATGKIDEVLAEIPRVREDLGFVPLVTPTSQIVGTQAVLNVLMKQRYKIISKEAAALLRGEYGATPAPVNPELQKRVLNGKSAITTRPADHLEPEMKRLEENLRLKLPGVSIEDVLTYALFPDVGLKFLENRSVQ